MKFIVMILPCIFPIPRSGNNLVIAAKKYIVSRKFKWGSEDILAKIFNKNVGRNVSCTHAFVSFPHYAKFLVFTARFGILKVDNVSHKDRINIKRMKNTV